MKSLMKQAKKRKNQNRSLWKTLANTPVAALENKSTVVLNGARYIQLSLSS